MLGAIGLRRAHPLGQGLWRADFERVDRASQRVLQMLARQQLDDTVLRTQLDACHAQVWRCCEAAFERAPDADQQVPAQPDLAAVHRHLSRAATSVAQTAQALVMSGADPDAPARALRSATAHADAAALVLGLRE